MACICTGASAAVRPCRRPRLEPTLRNASKTGRPRRIFRAVADEQSLTGSYAPPKAADLDCYGVGSEAACVVAEPAPVVECVGTGSEAACLIVDPSIATPATPADGGPQTPAEWAFLCSPFFFWGTAMVAMKGVLPITGPLFVSSVRLLPAGALLVLYGLATGRPLPRGRDAWLAIAVFAVADATLFQGCLAEGLRLTPAGLGSVIIDSQPLTVAVLASLFYGETIKPAGRVGLLVAVIGLLMLEIPAESMHTWLASLSSPGATLPIGSSDEQRGVLWMLAAAQSMAVGTILVRWVCKFADPVMATGFHMILGSLPLVAASFAYEPSIYGRLGDLGATEWAELVWVSLLGSAVSYGIFFYNARSGNLSRLSSLTFLTPLFATAGGYLVLGEQLTPQQLAGAGVTLLAIALISNNVGDAKTE